MKKTLLALAVAGFSFNAAAVDLTDGSGTLTLAKEAEIVFLPDNAADAVADHGSVLVADFETAVGLDKNFVRFDLSNGAKFAGTPTLGSHTIAAGGADESYVVFTSSAPVAKDAALTATFVGGLKVANKNPVTVTYGQYESPQGANNATGALDTKSAVLLNFADALTVKAEQAPGIKKIDVASAEKLFDGAVDTSNLLQVSIVENADVKVLDGSTDATITALAGVYTWEVAGDFGFVDATNGVTVKAGATDVTGNINADKNKVTFASTDITADTTTLALKANGTDVITAGSYSVTLKPNASITDYKLSDAQTVFNNVATLKKNGAQADIDLALSPNSSFEHYVRITNDSDRDGKVFVRVYNDKGESADLTLADLGQTESLTAGHSAQPVSVKQLYKAAQLKNSTLASDYIGMLRLEVTSELKSIDVQSYSVSTDANANSFNVFN